MFKREKKVYLELTDAERRLVRMYLMSWRNKLTAQGVAGLIVVELLGGIILGEILGGGRSGGGFGGGSFGGGGGGGFSGGGGRF